MCQRRLDGRPCAGCLGFVPLRQVKLVLCGPALLSGRPCWPVVTKKRKAAVPLLDSGLREADTDTTLIRDEDRRGSGRIKKRKIHNNITPSKPSSETVLEEEPVARDFREGEGEDQLGDIVLFIPKIPALPPGVDFATADPKDTGYILCSTCAAAKAREERRGAGRLAASEAPMPDATAVAPTEGEEVQEDEESAYEHHDEDEEEEGFANANDFTSPDFEPERTVTEQAGSNDGKLSYDERHAEAVLLSTTNERIRRWVEKAASGKQGPGVGRRVR